MMTETKWIKVVSIPDVASCFYWYPMVRCSASLCSSCPQAFNAKRIGFKECFTKLTPPVRPVDIHVILYGWPFALSSNQCWHVLLYFRLLFLYFNKRAYGGKGESMQHPIRSISRMHFEFNNI